MHLVTNSKNNHFIMILHEPALYVGSYDQVVYSSNSYY